MCGGVAMRLFGEGAIFFEGGVMFFWRRCNVFLGVEKERVAIQS